MLGKRWLARWLGKREVCMEETWMPEFDPEVRRGLKREAKAKSCFLNTTLTMYVPTCRSAYTHACIRPN